MTVKELIIQLQSVEDQDMRIMVGGYEGGFNDLETTANNIQEVALDVNSEWYYGAHDLAELTVNGKYQIVKAIVL